MTLTTNEITLERDVAGGASNTPIEVGQPTDASGFDEHPGFIASRSYPIFNGTMVSSGGAVAAALGTNLVVQPVVIKKPITLTGVEVFVYTAGTGSAFKAAVYGNKDGLPYGAPLGSDATGVGTVTSQTAEKSPIAVTLQPGVYWIAQKHNLGTGAPTLVSADSPNVDFASLLGQSDAYKNPTLSLYTPAVYTDPWPSFTGAETWTEGQGSAYAPLPWLRT